jgi:Pla-1/cef family extracellular lipase
MRKLAISIAITSVLGLSACGDKSLKDVQQENAELLQQNAEIAAQNAEARVRVVWDPSNSEISVPNDLLLSGTIDGTLEMPDETSAKDAGEAVDFSNPSAALGALDGWGTQNSFSIALEYEDEDLTIDATTITSSDAVAIYQVEKFPSTTDSDCTNTDYSGLICKGIAQLTYGEDYVTSMSGDDLVVVLAKPLQAGASYAVALTNTIKDSNGNDLMPSSTYASVEQDIETTPLVLPSLSDDELNETQAGIRLLQTLTNNFENSLVSAFSADKDDIVYTQVFTTQSAGVAGTDPLQVTKLLNAKVFAATAAVSEAAVAKVITSKGYNVAEAFAGAGQTLTATATALYSSSDVYSAEIEVPYYLETTETGDPLSGRWEAACDSGAILASLTDEVLATGTAGDNHTTCDALGLADLGFDTQRHLTKYNPLPDTKSTESIDVQVTLPNVAAANSFRDLISGGSYEDIAKPVSGWPVVLIQHGITSKKEDMLATTGWLSVMGYATVAIDHPLHGDRGFTIVDGDTTTVINASSSVEGGAATSYFNLSSLLTSRDNLRQSTADILKLRLALNGFTDGTADPKLDATNVYFMGHSLGAITGVNAVAIANTLVTADTVADSTIEDEAVRDATAEATATALNNLYKIKAAVFANPGSSIANFLVESGSFSPLVKASVVYGLDNELTEALQANIDDLTTVVGANLAGDNPSDYCSDVYASVLASETPEQSDGLICAFDEFMNTASADEQTAVATAVTQFAFAAQATLEAGDPSNYTQLLKALETPVLVYEIAGDGTDANLPDQTIPNSVSTDPFKGITGTTGLANQLGLSSIIGSIDGTEATSGIVRFTSGSHSTFASPVDPADTDATVHTEMQTIMYQFFNSDGKTYSPTAGKCVVQNVLDESCTE